MGISGCIDGPAFTPFPAPPAPRPAPPGKHLHLHSPSLYSGARRCRRWGPLHLFSEEDSGFANGPGAPTSVRATAASLHRSPSARWYGRVIRLGSHGERQRTRHRRGRRGRRVQHVLRRPSVVGERRRTAAGYPAAAAQGQRRVAAAVLVGRPLCGRRRARARPVRRRRRVVDRAILGPPVPCLEPQPRPRRCPVPPAL